MGFTNNKTDKILEFKNQGIKAAAGTVYTLHCFLMDDFYSDVVIDEVDNVRIVESE